MKRNSNHIFYFDYLRLFAIIGVILIHVVIPTLYKLKSDPFEWWVGVSFQSMFLWAVPIFFMISGSLLLNKEESLSVIYTKRLPKIILPFIFWTVVYIFFDVTHSNHTWQELSIKAISEPIIYHLWFIYTLIGLYVVTPLIRVLTKNLSRNYLEYLIILSFIVSSIFPLIFKIFKISIGIPVPFAEGYILYFLLGYYLVTYPQKELYKLFFYLLGLTSFLIIIFGTYFLTVSAGKYDNFFHKPLSFPVVFSSIFLFLFFKERINFNYQRLHKITNRIDISRVCFGIYFSHVAIMGVLASGKFGIKISIDSFNPLISIPLTTFFIFCICFIFFIILELLKKVPMIRLVSKLLY